MNPAERLRLLVVDDNAEWRGVIAEILETEHDLVGEVERGDDIMTAAQELRPGLITLDVSLPGVSGLTALPSLRAICPQAIIVMVSVTSTALYEREALARGADGYVDKGRVRSELLETIVSIRDRQFRDASLQ